MRRALITTALSFVAAVTAAAATAASTAASDVSSNWAGYTIAGAGSTSTAAATSMTFTDVTGTWVQPAGKCVPGDTASAAMWVGLGGYSENSQALEQTGTEVDCSLEGKATYSIWYEVVPQPSQPVKLKIAPGDTITASVYVTNGTDVLMQVKDRTRDTTFTKRMTVAQPDLSSAEWIAEAPETCDQFGHCNPVGLANFGSVTFSKIAAIGNGAAGTLFGTGWEYTPIQLVPGSSRFFGGFNQSPSSTAGATPESPAAGCSAAGCSFGVKYVADATGNSPYVAAAARNASGS
jgi:hypothetical protein